MKLYILEGILKDSGGENSRYTETQLQAYARWACAELSQHTAQADCFVIQCDGQRNTYPLPSDMIGSIEDTGLVAYNDGSNIIYLPVYRSLPEVVWPTDLNGQNRRVYWEWPSGQLTLGFIPANSTELRLYFFRIWTPPEHDEDLLVFPQWMEQAFVYLFAAAAMEPYGAQAANIRTWNRKQDSGNPEHNPAQKQAKWFTEQAWRILSKQPPQDRATFYLNNPRKPMR